MKTLTLFALLLTTAAHADYSPKYLGTVKIWDETDRNTNSLVLLVEGSAAKHIYESLHAAEVPHRGLVLRNSADQNTLCQRDPNGLLSSYLCEIHLGR